ncbi:MAG: acyltransferase [Deltaproteobacteria bacterium]|nr:acyltransferase [Deltaproteobacteria bacterium]
MGILRNILSRFIHKIAFVIPGGFSVRPSLHRFRGAFIGKNVWISQYVYIDELHPEGVTIHDNCTIGIRTSIITHTYWGKRKNNGGYREVVIEKNVYIGPHSLILPGVRIGEGAVIKGGTTVSGSVPPFTFWGYPKSGPLARITVPMTSEHEYEDFVEGLRPIIQKRTRD